MLISASPDVHLEDAALVRAAQGGDRSAFGALYEQYGRMVHGILLAHVSYADAEDLLQDVFIRAMQQLRSLREPAAFGAWLAAIARRCAVDLHRKPRLVSDLRDRPGGSRPDCEAFAVLAALQELPKAYRETLILRLVEGMNGPEIATRTGLTPESVRVNLCRGMKLLRQALGGESTHE
ncbi:MAG: sigma-70 family RNA polymerase sigma factor [Bryobacteraceae bacterium]